MPAALRADDTLVGMLVSTYDASITAFAFAPLQTRITFCES